MDELIKLNIGKVYLGIDTKDLNTYKLSYKCNLVIPNDLDSLIKLINYLKINKIEYKVIGNGSNLIFTKDYEGVLIKLDCFNKIEILDNSIILGAGLNLMSTSLNLSMESITNFEFLTGIPGTIGGSIIQNAGAFNKSISDILIRVWVLSNGEIKILENKDLEFSYRSSKLKNSDLIILKAEFKKEKGNIEEILSKIKEYRNIRNNTQPKEASAGSVFKNPEGKSAGALIDKLGLKGKMVGDSMVSNIHANFIINKGASTGEDILTLINLIKDEVYKNYGIKLELEQEII